MERVSSCPVTMTIGTSPESAIALNFRQISNPLAPGRFTSSSTRSGLPALKADRAPSAVLAIVVPNPACCKVSDASAANTGSSSIMSTWRRVTGSDSVSERTAATTSVWLKLADMNFLTGERATNGLTTARPTVVRTTSSKSVMGQNYL